MNKLNYSVALVIVSFFTLVTNVFAQINDPFGNRSTADISISYKPPAVYVTKIDIDENSAKNLIKGRFLIWNNEKETINGLLYRIDLLDPLPQNAPADTNVEDTAAIYDRYVSNAQFSLRPNERKEIGFSYQPPAVPEGNYRLQITATNQRGRDMGWWDANLQLKKSANNFIFLQTGPLLSPEYPDRKFPAQAGPNVTPETEIALNFTAENKGALDITLVPALYLYEFDLARGLREKIKGTQVTIQKQQSQNITFPVVVSILPRVYYAVLALEDPVSGQRMSNLAEYRWVVKGEHAEIMTVRVTKFSAKKDYAVVARIDLVGAADAQTKTAVNLLAQIYDNRGLVGSIDVGQIELNDKIYSTQGPIKLTRNLEGVVKLRAELKNTRGTVIDAYEIVLDSASPERKAGLSLLRIIIYVSVATFGIAALVVLAKFIFSGFKKQRLN